VERRKHPRTRVLKGAKIVLGSTSVVDCVVRDLTNAGARLRASNVVNLPKDVAITFDSGRTCRAGRVAWRKVEEAGLEFTAPDRSSED
jgi:hypothetical protein